MTATAFLAVSGQQAIGLGVAIAIVVGWGIYLLVVLFRSDEPPGSEIELAPNRRPYLDDDALEGPKLDRVLKWGLVSLAFIAVALPWYWLREPTREAHAERGFDKRSVDRGGELFLSAQAKLPPGHIAAGCADCHGNKGQGGTVEFTITRGPKGSEQVIPVKWEAPAINTVMMRFSPDEVRTILVYGRPPTPMPAWGVLGGGALSDQQIDDLVNYLVSIQITPKEAQAAAKQNGTDGQALFDAYCARCHTLGWSYRDSYQEPDSKPGCGAYGPNLCGGDEIRQFPDAKDHLQFIQLGSDFAKNYGVRGIGTGRMPGFADDPNRATATQKPGCNNTVCTTYRIGPMLTTAQIKAIVDYERTL